VLQPRSNRYVSYLLPGNIKDFIPCHSMRVWFLLSFVISLEFEQVLSTPLKIYYKCLLSTSFMTLPLHKQRFTNLEQARGLLRGSEDYIFEDLIQLNNKSLFTFYSIFIVANSLLNLRVNISSLVEIIPPLLRLKLYLFNRLPSAILNTLILILSSRPLNC